MVRDNPPPARARVPARVPLSEQALEDVQYLRRTVERHARVTTLSPAALLVTGIAGLAAAGVTAGPSAAAPLTAVLPGLTRFTAAWFAALAVSAAVNCLGMGLRAHREGLRFRSSALRAALWATAAPLTAGGVFSAWALRQAPDPWTLAVTWTAFYGLALLAASPRTSRAVGALGGGSLAAAGALLLLGPAASFAPGLALGAVFGVGHLLLAVYIGGRYGW